MIKEKGSVVISMKGKSVLKPDHDGTKVLNLCHYGNGYLIKNFNSHNIV